MRRGHLDSAGKGDSFHENMLSKTLVRVVVLKITSAQFQEVKEDYYNNRLHAQQVSCDSLPR